MCRPAKHLQADRNGDRKNKQGFFVDQRERQPIRIKKKTVAGNFAVNLFLFIKLISLLNDSNIVLTAMLELYPHYFSSVERTSQLLAEAARRLHKSRQN